MGSGGDAPLPHCVRDRLALHRLRILAHLAHALLLREDGVGTVPAALPRDLGVLHKITQVVVLVKRVCEHSLRLLQRLEGAGCIGMRRLVGMAAE